MHPIFFCDCHIICRCNTVADTVAKGIEYLNNTLDHPHYFIFTNDPEAVKQQYQQLKNATYIYDQTDYQDFRLMMSCDHFLISNSTFSWWASYLGTCENKIIIVPEKWRNNQFDEPALMKSHAIHYVKIGS